MSRISLNGCIVAAVAAMSAAQAQTYPTKLIRIISPYTAGGLGAGLTETLSQQILVEKRPGASQTIGMQLVAKSRLMITRWSTAA